MLDDQLSERSQKPAVSGSMELPVMLLVQDPGSFSHWLAVPAQQGPQLNARRAVLLMGIFCGAPPHSRSRVNLSDPLRAFKAHSLLCRLGEALHSLLDLLSFRLFSW